MGENAGPEMTFGSAAEFSGAPPQDDALLEPNGVRRLPPIDVDVPAGDVIQFDGMQPSRPVDEARDELADRVPARHGPGRSGAGRL